jgi:hypothetical protein
VLSIAEALIDKAPYDFSKALDDIIYIGPKGTSEKNPLLNLAIINDLTVDFCILIIITLYFYLGIFTL